MDEYIWRKIKTISVPDPDDSAWTPGLDYFLAKRIYRLKAGGTWTVGESKKACGPDGMDLPEIRTQDLVCPTSRFGALVAKIGGGTADNGVSVFAVGRYCVFRIEDETKLGPLYLGVNEMAAALPSIKGKITVEIEVAI